MDKIELFLNEAQSATVTTEQGGESTIEVGGELSGLLGKLLGKYQSKRTEKKTRQIVLKPPTADRLSEICGIMVDILLRLKLVDHVLVLVDDVDLLESYKSPQQNASFQRNLLADALRLLHEQPGLDMVLTARSWFRNSRKDWHTLVDLGHYELRPEDLVAIHDRQLEAFAKKAEISCFLKPEALAAVAAKVKGLPGVFLQFLAQAFYEYQNDDDWNERDYDWFLGVFRRIYSNYRNKCAPGAALLEQNVRDGRLEVDVTPNNPFVGTVFDNLLVYQSYYNECCYFAPPLVSEILALPAPILAPAPTEGTP